ncbi:MAG: Hsp20/alpha crystallin family protein [Desulfuromonadaceae bacterium]|nr:Hsp20/alpha crystallin family protein [Desulfuromonadaceae bacterium]MDD2849926.1 Hsp20/alpha crystallin family protein [Desulfuromonadaceae bacterium]MDD4131715.1 Hsp20/alpha crystallin family protein [Desulfuromonadaceae bacterium]
MSNDKQEVAVKKSGGERKGEMQKYIAPLEQMERMFEDFFQRRFFAPSWMPRLKLPEFADVSASVDMFEEGDDLVIKADIPGMKKDEISIDFADNVVTISGEKKTEERTERKDYYCVERSFGSFNRKLQLPVDIKIDKTRATFKDGVLEIRMPKSEEAKQKVRKITVD